MPAASSQSASAQREEFGEHGQQRDETVVKDSVDRSQGLMPARDRGQDGLEAGCRGARPRCLVVPSRVTADPRPAGRPAVGRRPGGEGPTLVPLEPGAGRRLPVDRADDRVRRRSGHLTRWLEWLSTATIAGSIGSWRRAARRAEGGHPQAGPGGPGGRAHGPRPRQRAARRRAGPRLVPYAMIDFAMLAPSVYLGSTMLPRRTRPAWLSSM